MTMELTDDLRNKVRTEKKKKRQISKENPWGDLKRYYILNNNECCK